LSQERNTGLHYYLRLAWAYKLFQSCVGRRSGQQWLLEHHYRPQPGFRIVDIGCGPASIYSLLPNPVDYYGFDPNHRYINHGKKYKLATLMVGNVSDFMRTHGESLAGTVDLVICSGVLHHVSHEEINEILSSSKLLLREGGRFSALEPTFLEKQDLASKFVVKQDRGQSIFMDHEWASILKRHFPNYETWVLNNFLRIPYTHILLTGYK
jgi:SAM-dependent methyltransferase